MRSDSPPPLPQATENPKRIFSWTKLNPCNVCFAFKQSWCLKWIDEIKKTKNNKDLRASPEIQEGKLCDSLCLFVCTCSELFAVVILAVQRWILRPTYSLRSWSIKTVANCVVCDSCVTNNNGLADISLFDGHSKRCYILKSRGILFEA